MSKMKCKKFKGKPKVTELGTRFRLNISPESLGLFSSLPSRTQIKRKKTVFSLWRRAFQKKQLVFLHWIFFYWTLTTKKDNLFSEL